LAHVSLLADLPDRFRSEVLNRGQATDGNRSRPSLPRPSLPLGIHFVKRPERETGKRR
jgi:hypothetical protein